jgi:mono/diheme cytochrome c family protein
MSAPIRRSGTHGILREGRIMIMDFLDRSRIARRTSTGAACAAAVLFLWPLQTLSPQIPSGPTQNVIAGARVFGAKGCTECHAINGLGGTVGPDLGEFPGTRSYYDFAAAMWNHLPGMVDRMRELGLQRPQLDPWETGDLIAFLFWLDYFDRPGDADAGGRLFEERQCIACHQAGVTGGVAGPNLDFLTQYGSPIQIATAMWNHGPAMTEAMEARGISRPAFTGQQLGDLVAFLKSTSSGLPEGPMYILPGRADMGLDLFASKRCLECHGVLGTGGGMAPDLAAQRRQWSLIEFAAAMWNKGPAMTRAMAAQGINIPQLRAWEMADIVAYLSSVRYFGESGSTERGPRRIRAKGCLDCHSLNGQGGTRAGDLARTRGLNSAAAVFAAMWNHVLVTEAEPGDRQVDWPTFNAQEMADLAAFLQSSGGGR